MCLKTISLDLILIVCAFFGRQGFLGSVFSYSPCFCVLWSVSFAKPGDVYNELLESKMPVKSPLSLILKKTMMGTIESCFTGRYAGSEI